MSRTSFIVSVALLSLTLTGCLLPKSAMPRNGVATSGEPLAVVDDVKVWTTTRQEKVGDTTYKDASGNVIGTSATYANKTEVHARKIWYPVQGTEQITDDDFFRIAGDKSSFDQTVAMRQSGARWRRNGFILMGGGFAASLIGAFLPSSGRLILGTAGLGALVGGYYVTWVGARRLDPETHAVDRAIADQAAKNYNQSIGKAATVGVSRTF